MAATPDEAGKFCREKKKHTSFRVSKSQKTNPDHYLRGKRGEGEVTLCSDSTRPWRRDRKITPWL
jgi:ribosomal protein L44E